MVGSQTNLERVYALSTFAKIRGTYAVYQDYAPAQLNLDLPSLYSLNFSVQNLAKVAISGLILIGANPRFEASLLNTALRREQFRRGFSYLTVGAFTSLRYAQTHQGNSYRTLFASLENRVAFVKSRLALQHPVGILLSINSLRNENASYLQKLVVSLGKFNFTKTAKSDRLGFLHSSVGSLAFAALGLSTKKRGNMQNSTLFTVGQPAFSESFFR